jgi:hypothetical protein
MGVYVRISITPTVQKIGATPARALKRGPADGHALYITHIAVGNSEKRTKAPNIQILPWKCI